MTNAHEASHRIRLLVPAIAAIAVIAVSTTIPRTAAAQLADADSDGVADWLDFCAVTPTGSTVDDAGCPLDTEWSAVGTSVFLRSPYQEIGISSIGSLGTPDRAPAGWASQGKQLAMIADPARDGWANGYVGDYSMPGEPLEGFAFRVDGVEPDVAYGSELMGMTDVTGVMGTPVERERICGLHGGVTVDWSASWAGIDLQQRYSILNGVLGLLVDVSMTNMRDTPATVSYLRAIDSDAAQPWTGDYSTYNEVQAQYDGAGAYALVTATTRTYSSYLALGSAEPLARVGYGGFALPDPSALWTCNGFECLPGVMVRDDVTIALAVRRALLPGETARFSVFYAFTPADTDAFFACTAPSTCGDGQLTGAELCDDGNAVAGDGCDAACQPEAGWLCVGAPSVCNSTCGDGIVVGTEGCDDGATAPGDGCGATCQVETGWSCSGAPSTCATTCGDGVPAGDEACDDGGTARGDGCGATCQVETGWSCSGAPSACETDCGDGVLVGSEACDDANLVKGDGCSDTCEVEAGFACSGAPSACAAVCGDGLVAGDEACDDDGRRAGDGCSDACEVEEGFTCAGEPSACVATCGDGLLRGDETCDDGNADDGDGCSSACSVEDAGEGGGGGDDRPAPPSRSSDDGGGCQSAGGGALGFNSVLALLLAALRRPRRR